MIRERILKYIDYKGVTKYKFYQDTGFSNGFLDKKGAIGSDKCEKISYVYNDLDIEWLLTGRGKMLKSELEENIQYHLEPKYKQDTIEPFKKIPFFDLEAEGGQRHIVDMTGTSAPAEMIDAGDWFRDASAAMRVHGDSMYPKYPSGSIVVFKEVQDRDLIVYGQDYVIETSEYRVIKRIQTSKETGQIMASSYNKEKDHDGNLIHESFPIPFTKISRLFRILGKVERNESSRIVYNNFN